MTNNAVRTGKLTRPRLNRRHDGAAFAHSPSISGHSAAFSRSRLGLLFLPGPINVPSNRAFFAKSLSALSLPSPPGTVEVDRQP
jgi:hypothetical protein